MRIGRGATLAIVLVLVVSLFSALVYVVVDDIRRERESEYNYNMMQTELTNSGLNVEKLSLERQIRLLSDKEAKRLATVTLLCKTPSSVVYDRMRPILTAFGMTGTVCISPGSMPGDSGNMTAAQYKSLISRGYGSAVLYDGSAELSEYLGEMERKTAALGINMPTTLYVFGVVEEMPYYAYSYGTDGKPIFDSGTQAILSDFGIEHLIQETYQTKYVSYQNFYEPLRYCEAVGFNSKRVTTSFFDSLKTHAAVVMTVQFNADDNYGSYFGDYDGYSYDDMTAEDFIAESIANKDLPGTSADSFVRFLNLIKTDYSRSVKVLSIPAAAAYREEFNRELALDTDTEQRLKELSERLEEVNLTIWAIEEKYGFR